MLGDGVVVCRCIFPPGTAATEATPHTAAEEAETDRYKETEAEQRRRRERERLQRRVERCYNRDEIRKNLCIYMCVFLCVCACSGESGPAGEGS